MSFKPQVCLQLSHESSQKHANTTLKCLPMTASLNDHGGGVVATPDDERDFQAEGGGERSQKTLAA